MAFNKGQESTEGVSIKRYVGVAPCYILAVNPDEKKAAELLGYESTIAPYVGEVEVNGTKVKNVRLDFIVKTDEERVQNMPFLFPGDPDKKWIVTEKIDGTSTTFTMKGRKKKEEFYICSRNVNFDKPEKAENCFYETNVYIEMAEKYNMESVLRNILENHPEFEFVTIQGETYGANIQKRDYGLTGHDFMAFNLIFGYKDGRVERLNPIDMTSILVNTYNIPCVPVLDTIILPETIDEMIAYANGKSLVDGGMREGVVLRTLDGVESFKSVSNDFLIKYHQ